MIPARALAGAGDLYISAVYTPPDADRIPSDIDCIINTMESLININSTNKNYILIGDFNLPCISWSNCEHQHLNKGPTEVQNAAVRLTENMSFAGLKQYNYIKNYADNTLDLSFSSIPLRITSCDSPLVSPDRAHPPLVIEALDLAITPFVEASLPKFSFRKGDYTSINETFGGVDWHSLLDVHNAEESCDIIYEVINKTILQFVPIKAYNKKHRFPTWYSPALIKIIKEKDKAHKKWKKFNNLLDYYEFSLLRKRQNQVQKECFNHFVKASEEAIKYKPKSFWTYVKSMRGGSNYPKQLSYRGSTVSDGKAICDAFNSFFENVFGSPSIESIARDETVSATDTISVIGISSETIHKKLLSLDVSKGAGSDGIPPLFLRNCAKTLCIPLALLYLISP